MTRCGATFAVDLASIRRALNPDDVDHQVEKVKRPDMQSGLFSFTPLPPPLHLLQVHHNI
jgi:hypothetical protein